MRNPFQRITVMHVIALLLLMIWLQVGGAQFVAAAFNKAAYAVSSIGEPKEEPAKTSASEARWADEFAQHMYGTPAASAASAP